MNSNSRDIKAFLKKAFIYLEEGNTKEYFKYVADDVVCVVTGSQPLSGTHRGIHDYKELFLRMERLLREPLKFKTRQMVVEGNRAAIVLEAYSKTLDGLPLHYVTCWIVDINNNKIDRVEVFSDAIALANLFESAKATGAKRT